MKQKKPEKFRKRKGLEAGEPPTLFASVNPARDMVYVRMIFLGKNHYFALTVSGARALRDWLTTVLPEEKS